jgi:hypothetical protein
VRYDIMAKKPSPSGGKPPPSGRKIATVIAGASLVSLSVLIVAYKALT